VATSLLFFLASTEAERAQNVEVRRAYEGPQLVLTWDHPRIPVLEITVEDSWQDIGDDAARSFAFQTFQLTHDFDLSRVDLRLARTGLPEDSIKVSIYDTAAGDPDNLLVEMSEVEGRLLPEQPTSGSVQETQFTIPVADQITLTGGTTYALVIERTGAIDAVNYYNIRAEAAGTYFKGNYGVGDAVPAWTGGSEDAWFKIYERGAVRIRRQEFDFPQAPSEGTEVFAGDTESFSDIVVSSQQVQYYTVFTDIASQLFDTSTQGHEMVADNQGTPGLLFSRVPAVYQQKDRQQGLLRLRPEVAELDGEQFNWLDDQSERGQLERFLKLFALENGVIQELIAYYRQFYNVCEVDLDHLPFLADQYGWRFIGNTSNARQRFLVKNAIFLYRIRGTQDGIIVFVEMIFGVTPIVTESRNNVLFSNTVGSTSLDFDPGNLAKIGNPDEEVDYVIDFAVGSRFNHRGLNLFLPIRDIDVDPDDLTTLLEYFALFVPSTVAVYIFAQDGSGGYNQINP